MAFQNLIKKEEIICIIDSCRTKDAISLIGFDICLGCV